ncbi:flagellar hook-associated protein FlgK [Oceanicoccus sagamiensis]|uniref:Flagellar hook-associated protein 1 n=1 Tax=Oceanicoccus sagamiensis TaxID=716816 RepID=A0A1X9NDM6_9GAMM|nr:flagellar hook-associated protein FlgK [Oceanicoccus sagamiensis]ARN73057.1 flagellar hook-associated protein FlgK [Oceanicoccus sagamiensis]
MSLLGIGVSGLNISQTSLQVTGNNIANADQPSYSRQRVEVATLPEQLQGSGFIGAGAIVNDIGRVVDQFLINQIQLDTASFNNLNIFTTNIDQLDTLLADDFSGLGPAIGNFFAAIEASAQDPTSEPARQVVISEAEGLAQRINTLSSRVLQQSDSVNDQVTSLTTQVSTLASGIAALNTSIQEEIGRAGGAEPNQLLDQRDELLRQLSELVSVTTVDNDNSLSVFIGNGLPLVVGGDASQLGTTISRKESGNVEVSFIDQNGVEQEITEFVSGGKLGGLLEFRDEIVVEVINSLGRLAIGLADALNQQNSLGVDLDGNLGGGIFRDINDGDIPGQRVIVDSANSDPENQVMAVNITDISQLTTSDYILVVTDLDGDADPDYQVIRSSDGVEVYSASGNGGAETINFGDGFDIDIDAATPSSLELGDRLYIRPTRSGGSDMAVEISRVQELAYGVPIVTDAKSGNTGQGVISSGTVLDLVDDTAFNFAAPAALPLANPVYSSPGVLSGEVLVVFTSATDYTVYANSDATAPELLFSDTIVPGQANDLFSNNPGDANYIGFQAEISGFPDDGDEFTFDFNANGSSDNRNAVALGQVRTNDILDGGSTNFENAYGSLIEEIGTKTAQSQISRDAAQSLLFQSQANRDSMSGVNLDEEAANLIKFEQSYNASAQIITIARQIFDTLLGILR